MYNRYVPKPDGSFQRNWVPDTPPEPTAPQPVCPPVYKDPGKIPQPAPPPRRTIPQNMPAPSADVGGFFRKLLPRDFSTEDLLVVLLLLLMSGDSKEDQNYALLTLALYLFL